MASCLFVRTHLIGGPMDGMMLNVAWGHRVIVARMIILDATDSQTYHQLDENGNGQIIQGRSFESRYYMHTQGSKYIAKNGYVLAFHESTTDLMTSGVASR